MKPTIALLLACIFGYHAQAVETSEPPQWVKDKVHKNASGQVTGTRFITKYYLWRNKFAIASTDAVSDADFDVAIEKVDLMIGHREDILTQLFDMGHVMLLFNGDDNGPNEKVSDFGCYASTGADNYGYGGNPNTSGGTVSSLNIENYGWENGNGVYREDIFLHEFAHGIHLCGLNNTDFNSRLLAHFNASGRAIWANTYADDDHKEYWAEISQSYFDANYEGIDPYHNGWNTKEELLANDPTGYAFCEEVYGRSAVDKDAKITANQTTGSNFCGDFSPSATLSNVGSNTLSSAMVTLTINGSNQETINWTGNLEQGEEETVNFSSVVGLSGTLNVAYKVTLTGDENEGNDEDVLTLDKAPLILANGPSSDITIEFRPDAWGSEVSWELRDESNTVLLNGGPYQDYTTQNGGNWTADTTQITTDNQTLTIQSTNAGCFTLSTNDEGSGGAGDGFYTPNNPEWGKGFYRIKDANGTEILYGTGDEDPKSIVKVFEVAFNVGLEESGNELAFTLYPQPTRHAINIKLSNALKDATLEVFDMLGQLTDKIPVNGKLTTWDVSHLPRGTYTLRLSTSKHTSSRLLLLTN